MPCTLLEQNPESAVNRTRVLVSKKTLYYLNTAIIRLGRIRDFDSFVKYSAQESSNFKFEVMVSLARNAP